MPKKKINYKQLAQEGRKDLFNIIAYYPTKRNIERLEKILNVESRLKEISNDPNGGLKRFLKYFPKLSNLQDNEEMKSSAMKYFLLEIYKKIFQYGTTYLKKVPIKFQRGQGAAWKSRHGPVKVLFGWYDREKGVIHIRTHLRRWTLPEDEIKDTIIHELMHAYAHSLAIAVDKINKEYPVLKIKQTRGLDNESAKAHDNILGKTSMKRDEYFDYLHSASELYARGGSPRLRLYLNKLKGKKGRDLNDDINAEDIFTACKKAADLMMQSEDPENPSLGNLEFIWKTTACQSYMGQILGTMRAAETDEKLSDDREFLKAFKEAHKQVLKKFKITPEFRKEFEKASENINDLAKNLDQDPQKEPRAIAEYKQTIKGILEEAHYKEIKEIFKRYL